jgi:hypothetical protein
MKKILLIVLLAVVTTTISYSTSPPLFLQGNPQLTSPSSFGARVLTPLKISCMNPVANLGDFVRSNSPYTNFDNTINNGGLVELDFQITGEPMHSFNYKVTPNLVGTQSPQVAQLGLSVVLLPNEVPDPQGGYATYTGDAVQLTGEIKRSAIFDMNGNTLLLSIIVTSLTAMNPGTDTFVQTITVSYNSL